MNIMRPYIEANREIICFSISGEMSTSGNVIRMAAADGKSCEEIRKRISELIPKVRASFVVDTLVYLYRGGRCSAVSALIGGALALHPMIVVKDGKMDASKKYRGKIGRVIKNYVHDLEDDMKNAMPDRVRLAFYLYQNNVIYAMVNNNSGVPEVNYKQFINYWHSLLMSANFRYIT